MAVTAWDGTTDKEGVITGVARAGIATIPGGATNTIYTGWAVEISGDSGANFTSKIGVEENGNSAVFTTYKSFNGATTLTGTFFTPNVGDILVASSTTIVVKKRNR